MFHENKSAYHESGNVNEEFLANTFEFLNQIPSTCAIDCDMEKEKLFRTFQMACVLFIEYEKAFDFIDRVPETKQQT